MANRRRTGVSREVKFVAAGAAAAFLILFLIFISVGRPASEESYSMVAPTVYQGAQITGADFIKIDDSRAGCYATLSSSLPTSESGVYTVTVYVRGNGGYERAHECHYTVVPVFIESVTVEAGFDEFPVEVFFTAGAESGSDTPVIEGSVPPSDTPGTYGVDVRLGDSVFRVTVYIVDTTPPTGTPVNVTITNETGIPKADDFVTDIKDATAVTCSFAKEYDFSKISVFPVEIILTDAAGNTTTLTATADCRANMTPPSFRGLDDIVVPLGGTVSYREGVTAKDSSGASIAFTVSADGVDLNKVGEYTAYYSATDVAGNTATAERKVFVVEKEPPTEAQVMALARKIYDSEIVTSDNMNKWDIAYAIFRWAHDGIRYVGTGIQKASWLQAAYDGFNSMSGDCFTYMSVSRAMFNLAGIDCVVVHKDKHEGEQDHYWLLVDIGDGYYHFDACRRRHGSSWESFMRTDAELQWFCDTYEEGYYRFVSGDYPERATKSYYN